MRLKLSRMLVRGVLLGVMALSAASASATGILQLYREALSSDAQYAAARADREAADALVTQSRGQLLPQLSINGGRTRNDQVVGTHSPAIGYDSKQNYGFSAVNGSLNLSQAVFRPQLWAAYAQSIAQVRQAEGAFLQAKQDLIIRVAQSYFEILLAEDNVTLAGEQKAAIAEQLKQAKRYFEAGRYRYRYQRSASALRYGGCSGNRCAEQSGDQNQNT